MYKCLYVKMKLAIFLVILGQVYCYYIVPGPMVIATKGQVWPKPQHQSHFNGYMILKPQAFTFQATGHTCKYLQEAIDRYLKILIETTNLGWHTHRATSNPPPTEKTWKNDRNFLRYIDVLQVDLLTPCTDVVPDVNMDEAYMLNITVQDTVLRSKSLWGILRGLETFSQLLYIADDGICLQINSTIINDFPRFHHRGLLLDTSRHFMPMFTILQILDGMAYNKLNVFHWHIVDDQSFPYQSKMFPQLSERGAYNSKELIYKPEDVQKVIRYAARRGIRVMMEFDTPGHTRSWGEGEPELLTTCYENDKPNGYLGPMDPTKNSTYTFLQQFFQEIVNIFPEKYLHLGGDEVDFDCWQSNPNISQWMKDANIVGDYVKLEEYFIQKLVDIVSDLQTSSVVWEEVYVNGVSLPKGTIVHVWKENSEALFNATKDGLRTIWSSCYYLDHLSNGGDWEKYYKCDPHTYYPLSPEQQKLVIGGEVCMWSEVVDATNVVQRIYPRASAVAEKLWSAQDADSFNNARKRLEEHVCRMNVRGIPAQPPNGPGYCL